MSSEWELVDRAKRGDEAAWTILIRQHHSRLLSLTLLITGCPDTAKDVAQETLVRLLSAEIRHRAGSVGGLLSTIAFRLAVKEKNRRARLTDIEQQGAPDAAASPLDMLLAEERDRHVAAAILALDDAHRSVLALRFYGGCSYDEIAELTGTPLGTVKSRIFYAVKYCQNELRKRGILE